MVSNCKKSCPNVRVVHALTEVVAAGAVVVVVHAVGGGEAGVGFRIEECGTLVLFEAGGGGKRGIPAFFVADFWDADGIDDSDDTEKVKIAKNQGDFLQNYPLDYELSNVL